MWLETDSVAKSVTSQSVLPESDTVLPGALPVNEYYQRLIQCCQECYQPESVARDLYSNARSLTRPSIARYRYSDARNVTSQILLSETDTVLPTVYPETDTMLPGVLLAI